MARRTKQEVMDEITVMQVCEIACKAGKTVTLQCNNVKISYGVHTVQQNAAGNFQVVFTITNKKMSKIEPVAILVPKRGLVSLRKPDTIIMEKVHRITIDI